MPVQVLIKVRQLVFLQMDGSVNSNRYRELNDFHFTNINAI
jgi:hypothetical protein